VARAFAETAAALLGEQAIQPPAPELGVEDFAQMARRVPGAIVMLGAQPHPDPSPHHNAHFDLDEACLPLGAALLAGVACRLLSGAA
jgi:amidohydrolase